MGEVYGYEAAVAGDDLAALFAGYLLKQNRIRFVMLEKSDEEISNHKNEAFPYEITEENKVQTEEIYQKLAAQVGISVEELQSDVLGEDAKKRLKTLLVAELKEELESRRQATVLRWEPDMVTVKCAEETLEAYVLICQNDILTAGYQATAVLEEKQRRLGEYMKRLRIRAGKKNSRKMVYAAHSKNWFYAKESVMKFAVDQGAAPINPYMNYGFYLNGTVKKDEIKECGHQLIRSCDELWVFGPISEDILTDIAVAVMSGKSVRFFSISENPGQIRELKTDDIIFEREVHAGQIKKSDLLNFVQSSAPRGEKYVQMSLFD